MTDKRFLELLRGPLNHPVPFCYISRLALALRALVEMTGARGEQALEDYCANSAHMDSLAWEEWPTELRPTPDKET